MTKPVRRPERRNRKIGTAAAGHGQNNKMAIPQSRIDRFGNSSEFYDRMQIDDVREFKDELTDITILYETPRDGYSYGCSPADIQHLLTKISDDDRYLLELIIFRQPTIKQTQLRPVWGRLVYTAEIRQYLGPAIILEAQKINSFSNWPRRLDPEDHLEIERLKAAGFQYELNKRTHSFKIEESPLRNTLLYRAVLHELGHLKQYELETLDEDTCLHKDHDIAWDLYRAKPQVEREQYANRYADELFEKLRAEGHIPFPPKPFEIPQKKNPDA